MSKGVLDELSGSRKIKTLIDRCAYYDAHDLLERLSPEYKNTPLHSQQLATCLSHLAEPRRANAIILRAWRKYPEAPELIPRFLRINMRRKGLLETLYLCREFIKKYKDESLLNSLHTIEANILTQYRDYVRASAIIESRKNTLSEHEYALECAEIAYHKDDFQNALSFYQSAAVLNKHHRYSRQLIADILARLDRRDEAIETLEALSLDIQSFPVNAQLCELYIQAKDFESANKLVEINKTLIRSEKPEAQQNINIQWSNILCSSGKYLEALPYLETHSKYGRSVRNKIKQSQDQSHSSSERIVLDVPFEQQSHMTCAPASITSLAKFWGKTYEQKAVADAICYNGTPAVDERRWLLAEGWTCLEFELSAESGKNLIRKGIPFLLSTVEPGSAHLQVVCGFDDVMGAFLIRDPNSPRLVEMLIDESIEYYAASGPRVTLMLPASAEKRIKEINLPSLQEYDLYYQFSLALDAEDRAGMQSALEKLLEKYTGHRLVLTAEQNICYFDGNLASELAAVNRLLERYPSDVNLILRKASLLSGLGSTEETSLFLSQALSRCDHHYLVRSRLANELRLDARNHGRVETLLVDLLHNDSLNGETLQTYAALLWDKEEKQHAYELYRLLICLDEKDEGYANQYFRAARHFKETDSALAFLKQRFDDFTKHSSGPAISYFNALTAIDNDDKGIDALHHALTVRNDDAYLANYLARELLYRGRVKECKSITALPVTQKNIISFLETSAEILEYELKRKEAINEWKKLVAHQALNQKTNSAVVRLYFELEEFDAGIQFIDSQIDKYPGNYNLLKVKLRYLDDSHTWIELHRSTLKEMINAHPDDYWAYQKLSYSYMQTNELESSLSYAKQALEVSPNSPEVHLCLGRVLFEKKHDEESKHSFRKAISLSCDCEDAYEYLIKLAKNLDDIREELSFIHLQLIQQVSFGDGIAAYYNLAKRWQEKPTLFEFLQFAHKERPDLWQSHTSLASFYIDCGNTKEAKKVLAAALERFSFMPLLHVELANVHRIDGDFELAIEQFHLAIAINPSWTRSSQQLADLYDVMGESQKAIETLKNVLIRVPDSAIGYGYLADIYSKYEQKNNAVHALLKAVELSPTYGWAWNKLKQLASPEQIEDAKLLLSKNREKFPMNELLLKIETGFIDSAKRRLARLLDFYKHNPRAELILSDILNEYLNMEAYSDGLTFCEEHIHTGRNATDIYTYQAIFHYQRHQREIAIEKMESLVKKDPNHYEGWRRLVHWYKDKKKLKNALDHCIHIHPNDTQVIIFVAETMEEHSLGSESERLAIFERCVRLDPSDSYNVLSYFDVLYKKGDYDQAGEVLNRANQCTNDIFLWTRQLQLAVKQSASSQEKITIWEKILKADSSNTWVSSTAWQLMQDANLHQFALDKIEALRVRKELGLTQVANVVAETKIAKDGQKNFVKYLLDSHDDSEYRDRELEAYIDNCIKETVCVNKHVLKKYRSTLIKDTKNWSIVGQSFANSGAWDEAWLWYQQDLDKQDIPAWALCLASLSARACEQWEKGVELMIEASAKPADNYREDIVTWCSFDALLNNDEALPELSYIDTEQLLPMNMFILFMARALMENPNSQNWLNETTPHLRQGQKAIQNFVNDPVISLANKKTQHFLSQYIKGSLLSRVYQKWQLSNRF